MYVNQIDSNIDEIIDQLYFNNLSKDPTYKELIDGKKINFVEHREKINKFIDEFTNSIDQTAIKKIINDKKNIQRIIEIIKRYVAYYYFMSIAFYYNSSIKDYRNNIIQYSKLQTTSKITIYNFFDTENNYQLITYFELIKDVSNILLMTELQKKTLNVNDHKNALQFLNSLGKEYIDNYILKIVQNKKEEKTIEVNAHNLIKTIVFRQIYLSQDKKSVYDILNESEDNKNEYIYIDIVVSNSYTDDFETFKNLFMGDEDSELLSEETYELIQEFANPPKIKSIDSKMSDLLKFPLITPIVDNFLRYHKDSEKIDIEGDNNFKIPTGNQSSSKNIQMLLLNQQRKKKDNTKAQIIVNKLDAISDLYSDNAKKNTEYEKEIKKNFYVPYVSRKVVLHNYLEETHVVNKIVSQGRKVMENNEYFLELNDITNRAYFNFKDFESDGVNVNLEIDRPINVLRYSNIQYISSQPQLLVETHTGSSDLPINLVGLAIGPFNQKLLQCSTKLDLVDIRQVEISYMEENEIKKFSSKNGFEMFLQIFRHFYLDNLKVKTDYKQEVGDSSQLYIDYPAIRKMNPDFADKVIYWIYDTKLDEYEFDTYENIKTTNKSDIVKYINAAIHDRIEKFLNEKLSDIICEIKDHNYTKSDAIIDIYTTINSISLPYQQKRDLIIREVLSAYKSKKNTQLSDKTARIYDRVIIPNFIDEEKKHINIIKIDTRNPFSIREFIRIEDLKDPNNKKRKIDNRCEHENVWKSVHQLKRNSINEYNIGLTDFIEKYVTETIEGDFVCKICGQVLPIKQFVQDGNFDNNTQRFITAYVPSDIALEDNIEYKKYAMAIKYLDNLINRVSLITNTNMLVGQTTGIKQKRKAIVKNIIDIFNKNNSSGLKNEQNQQNKDKYEILKTKYGIEKDFDSVIYFELDDSIFNFVHSGSDISADINRYKFNNILLYFIFVFMSELTSAQIGMMSFDKIGNIYTFLKYGPKLFSGLKIRKNITDNETADIMNYPILCYLIFIISYFLIKYKLWFYPSATNKTFNPVVQKIVIHSMVSIINNISVDSSKNMTDYVYTLTSSKFYGHLNDIFRSKDLVLQLKQIHNRFGSPGEEILLKNNTEKIQSISLETIPDMPLKTRKLPNLLVSGGLMFNKLADVIYKGYDKNTDATHGFTGHLHSWEVFGGIGKCTIDGELLDNVTGLIDRTEESYYFNIKKIADRRCISGTLHDFEGINDKFVCRICNKIKGDNYSNVELDSLIKNLHDIEDSHILHTFSKIKNQQDEMHESNENSQKILNELMDYYKKDNNDMLYGTFTKSIDGFIDLISKYVGTDNDLIGAASKYPIYLKEDVYIINHTYQGTDISEPIILTEIDKKIFFKENHPNFNRDIYYYSDNRVGQIDVFYDAVTLELLGYKEKHRDINILKKSNKYLIINRSVKDRLFRLGYESKYTNVKKIENISNIRNVENLNSMNFILDGLVGQHIINIKSIIDKIIEIIYSIKYYQQSDLTDDSLKSTIALNTLISKYAKVLQTDIIIDSSEKLFNDWNEIRDLFSYNKIKWSETSINFTDMTFISSDTINYYDVSSNMMIYYLLEKLKKLINSNTENVKTKLCQLMIEIINYVYNLYNKDNINQEVEYKRFDYVLSGTKDITVDLTRKGLSSEKAKQLDNDIDSIEELGSDADIASTEMTDETADELEDLKEEAESLDVEQEYYVDENEDYAE